MGILGGIIISLALQSYTGTMDQAAIAQTKPACRIKLMMLAVEDSWNHHLPTYFLKRKTLSLMNQFIWHTSMASESQVFHRLVRLQSVLKDREDENSELEQISSNLEVLLMTTDDVNDLLTRLWNIDKSKNYNRSEDLNDRRPPAEVIRQLGRVKISTLVPTVTDQVLTSFHLFVKSGNSNAEVAKAYLESLTRLQDQLVVNTLTLANPTRVEIDFCESILRRLAFVFRFANVDEAQALIDSRLYDSQIHLDPYLRKKISNENPSRSLLARWLVNQVLVMDQNEDYVDSSEDLKGYEEAYGNPDAWKGENSRDQGGDLATLEKDFEGDQALDKPSDTFRTFVQQNKSALTRPNLLPAIEIHAIKPGPDFYRNWQLNDNAHLFRMVLSADVRKRGSMSVNMSRIFAHLLSRQILGHEIN